MPADTALKPVDFGPVLVAEPCIKAWDDDTVCEEPVSMSGTAIAPARACHALGGRARFGTLATLSRDPFGYPFATLVAIAFDPRGGPLLLLSRLAEHTKNLEGDARASILVAEPDGADPLAVSRMTIVGTCARVGQSAEARTAFLATHPEATQYAALADFAMWRLEVLAVRWIGGFGRMQWVSAKDYTDASSASLDME